MIPRSSRPVLDSSRFGRTPLLFLLGLAACCLIAILALAIVVLQHGPAPTLVGLLLSLLPIPLLVALVLYLDRLEPEPRALLAALFGAGAGVAVITALLGRALGTGAITTPELNPHASVHATVSAGAAVGGALVSGTLLALVLLALLASRQTEIDGVEDGVVYGSMVGLGFALVANVYAYAVAWNAGAGALAEEFARRGVFGPVFEALFASLIGLGVAYAAARPALPTRYLAVLVGWIAAVAGDALWNSSNAEGGTRLQVAYIVLIVAVLALVIVVIADRRRVIAMITTFLPDFEDPEVVTGPDIRMLASLRLRRLGRQWARLELGIAGKQAMIQYQLAATELAAACHRRSLGQTSEDVYVSHRDDSLTLMRTAAAAVRRKEQLSPPPWIAPDSPSVFVAYRSAPPPPRPQPPRWPPASPDRG